MSDRTNVADMVPWLGQEEADAVAEVIASGRIAQGPRVARFEQEFGQAMQVPYAVATTSGTTALHLALLAAGVGRGDDVVVPSFSFIATANAVRYVGARPVFADVDPATGNVTADTLRMAITSATRAVIAADQGGVPVDLDEIRAACDPFGIFVIEDAGCAVGSAYKGRPVGIGADLTAWSFDPRSPLTTGEGGMLTTARPDWAARAKHLRAHGMSTSALERHTSVPPPAEEYTEVGFDYRMTDLQAAIGIVQLGRLPQIVARRREIAREYHLALDGIPGLRAVRDPDDGLTNYQSFWVEVASHFPTDRDGLLAALAEAGICARRGVMSVHRQRPYAGLVPRGGLPVTERLTDRTLILPVFHTMTAEEQARVIAVLGEPARLAA